MLGYGLVLGVVRSAAMKLPSFLMTAATLAMISAPVVLAADMPEWSGPPIYSAPPDDGSCSAFGSRRQVDDVWQAPQVAYILAARCADGRAILVYYNGGSTDRTDIRILRVQR
jgi:hypothetical protein